MSSPPYLGKNYIGHPTVQVGTKLRCTKGVKFVDGTFHNKHDEMMVEEATLNYYRSFTPGNYEVVSQPKRQSTKKV